MKKIVITRKVQLNFETVDKKDLPDCYKKWFGYRRFVQRAANYAMTHMFIQQGIKEMIYLTDGVKLKLANISKDEDGMFNTSKPNTTYQLLSSYFKGECPMGMLSGLNSIIQQKFQKESFDVTIGRKSLATFRDNIPMPIRAGDISSWHKQEDGNYSFYVYGQAFKTYFGRDLSGNESIFDRALCGNPEYKFCDSSIVIEKKGGKYKIFLLATFSFDKENISLNAEKAAVCRLSMAYPIVIVGKKSSYHIGTAEEYLHRRLQIKYALDRTRAACKYNKGGKGRKAKMKATDNFEKMESDYINSRMHLYSRMLIDYCIKHNCGKIVLENYKDVQEQTHEESEKGKFLLASWSYFNLSEKIKYKAAKVGIVVEMQGDAEHSSDPVIE